jgi:tetratricopeptide (TPR) repeat protein
MFGRIYVIFLLIFISSVAFAIPKPSEVKAAISSGNYALAENLLKEVMVESPTALVHYQLGQVYAMQGKHSQALNEFRQAQALDPTLRFASSASEFTKKLSDEQSIVAPVPKENSQQNTASQTDSNVGIFFAYILGGAALLTGLYFAYRVFIKRKEEKDARDATIADNKEKTSVLLRCSKQLDDALLLNKSSTYSVLNKGAITARIVSLHIRVRSMLGDIKDNKEVSSGRIGLLESNIDDAVDNATKGPPPSRKKPSKTSKAQVKTTSFKTQQGSVVMPMKPYHIGQNRPDAIYEEGKDSGSDSLTGIDNELDALKSRK